MATKKKWIAEAIKSPGALRKKLKVKAGKTIPAAKLTVKKSDSTKVKKEKVLAKTLKSFKK